MADSKLQKRYGNPPRIKMQMPTAATAAAAAPKPTEAAGTDHIPVTATVATKGTATI